VDTDRLAGELIARTLPKNQWTHEAHLRVGLWHSLRYPRDAALGLLRDRIRAYNLATGVQNTSREGYHETITRFYVAVIAAFLGSVDSSRVIDELAQEFIERFGDRSLPLRHYTRGHLFSADARLGWLEPDLESSAGA
jgi:hypothetical protein